MSGTGARRAARAARDVSRRERMLLRTAIALGALGAATLAGAIVLAATGAGGASSADGEQAAQIVAEEAASAAPSAGGSGDSGASGGDAVISVTGSVIQQVQPAWAARVAAQTGIPERALKAYAGATIQATSEAPGCGLGWNTLAAIGEVESDHGRIGGSALDAQGTASPAIIGIALDGDGVADIADTDDGALGGDTEHDRAVGPMQMIPQTWAAYAVDGSGDGIADPQNIDDAALAAAHYLCATGYDLSSSSGWIAAIAADNQGVDYNNAAATAANRFAAAG